MGLEPGARIGPYEILRLVGAGGMGEVYQGRDPRLGRHVAVKILSGEFAANPDRLRRFQLEACAAAALSHPNILAVYDVGTEGTVPYLVSEFLEGRTLRDVLNEGPLAMPTVLDLARQISSALAAAHARGIAHRDLKPENLFVTADGRVKILDFGIAKWTPAMAAETIAGAGSGAATGTGVVVGTVGYMAPEQATGRTVDCRCDQFAFGIVVYEMLSGRRTFQRASYVEELAAIVRDDPPPIAALRPEAPAPLQWLLDRCLAKDPAERYESTRDLHRDLETLVTHVLHTPMAASRARPAESELPVPRTSLVGREADLVRAVRIVGQDGVRLVTFTGPAGTGKTRLALRTVSELEDTFDGGVYFASLSTSTDPGQVPELVAQALGIGPSSQRPLVDEIRHYLARTLRSARTLLLLDSFEHLLDAVPFVIELLKLDGLTVVVTSREPLRLSEEHEIPVAPLPRPESARTASLDALARNPAVALFVERARTSKPDFALTAENTRTVAEICSRLDGLPLAIELAAARIKTLPPAAMLGRLENRLQILTGGARDLPVRQQTLRGAIAWSHDLLAEPEQRLFRRIAAFVGSGTFEAVEAVADARQDLGIDVIDGIDSLVNKSLLQLIEHPDGDPRLTMLETVREYGRERLAASGEESLVRKAHAAYYLVLEEEAAGAIEGPDQAVWLARLDRDRDDSRAALDWLIASKNADWGLRLATARLRYWELRELFTEGRARLAALLALPGAAGASPARAKALFAAGVLAAGQRDYAAQRPLFEEALRIYRQLGDRRGSAMVANALAIVFKDQGDLAQARRLFEESCDLSLAVADHLIHARTLSNLASVIKEQGDFDAALERHEQSVAVFRQAGDLTGMAWSLRHRAEIARERGDFARAEALYRESFDAFQDLGDAWSAGSLLIDLGNLSLDAGDTSGAVERFREAVGAFQHLGGHRRGLARALEGFALAAAADRNARRAIRLAGAAAALRNAVGTPLTPSEQRWVAAGLEPAYGSVSQAERSAAWIEGWSMPVEQAIADGMREDT